MENFGKRMSNTMKKLSCFYTELQDPNFLNNCYYYDHTPKAKNGKDFIEKYLIRSGKGSLLLPEMVKFGLCLSKMRCEHIKSAFLLGVLLYNNIKLLREKTDEMIKCISDNYHIESKRKPEPERLSFLYMWYLICLYHDFGYLYEDNSRLSKAKKTEIKEKIQSGIDFKNQDMNKNNIYIPSVLQELALYYFQLRLICPVFNYPRETCIDHGAASSLDMFTILKELHSKEEMTQKDDGLWYGRPLFDNYVIPSVWAIACHNIWLAEQEDKQNELKYRAFGLDKLIYTRGKSIIDMHEHPLLFLLCLVDTIEPVKKYFNKVCCCYSLKKNNAKIILDNSYVEFDNNTLTISSFANYNSSNCNFVKINDFSRELTQSHLNEIKNSLSFLESDHFKVSIDDTQLCLCFS